MPERWKQPTYEEGLALARALDLADAQPTAPIDYDLIARDPSTLTGPERMERARQVSRAEKEHEAAQHAEVEVARADRAASPRWKRDAYDFIQQYLVDHPTLFVDDLWEAGLEHTDDDRALGAVFRKIASAGFMAKTGEYRKSVRSNMTEKPVWRSKIYKPPSTR